MRNPFKSWQAELKTALTGDPHSAPDWVPRLADGDDEGYFQPGSAAWAVHSSPSAIVAGIRALLMQTLHPGAMAGIHDHSRFREDPLARLASTIRWIFTVTYGSQESARAVSGRVLALHGRIQGEFEDGHGEVRHYTANDPELLRWVHIAFTDAFLATHKIWGGPIPGGADAYVRDWAKAGELMGLRDAPVNEESMRAQLADWYDGGWLRADARVADVVRFLADPPLSPGLRAGYRVLFAAAVSSLEPQYRTMLGLRTAHLGPFPLPVVTATRVTLWVIKLALGRTGPSEAAARQRLARLGWLPA